MKWIYRTLIGMSILSISFFISRSLTQSHDLEVVPTGTNDYQKVTGDDSEEDRSHWDALYNTQTYIFGKEPAVFIKDHIDMLPMGRALDIAMGEGRNAVFMAKKGFSVDGVDISEVGIRKAKLLAKENHVSINTFTADLNTYSIQSNTYDVIMNINYLQKNLVPGIKKGLKHGGVVIFESYTTQHLSNPGGKGMVRDYLLNPGELRELFKDLEILIYKETNNGTDAVASLIARKP